MSIPLSSSAELRAFDAVARAGSMSAAARQLGLRQPTISAHIASLERSFGVELFHRIGGRVELTGFGTLLQEATGRMFRGEEQALAMLLGARHQYEGVLNIAAIGPYNVVPVLARYRAQRPRVKIVVSIGDSRTVARRVLDQQDDIGVLLHAVDDPRVHCVPHRRQPLVVFGHRGHPLAARAALRPHDLHGEAFVHREEGSRTRQIFDEGMAALGVKVHSALEIGSREGVREAVAQGLGLGVVARPAFVPDPRLVLLPIEGLALHTHVHMVCRRERRDAPLIAAFLAEARASRDADRATPGQGRPELPRDGMPSEER